MLLLLLRHLSVCISLFALFVLSTDCFVLLRNRGTCRKNRWNLAFVITLWVIAFYRSLYGGFFLSFSVYPVFDILYNIVLLLAGIYVAKRLHAIREVKSRVNNYFMLLTSVMGASTAQTMKKLRTVWLCSTEEKELHEILDKELNDSKITLNQLARKIRSNRTYVSRYFNHQMGMSYVKYAERKRLMKVSETLKSSDESVTVIYEKAGFTSSSFYANFKATQGMTPGEWRKVNKEEDSLNEGS